MNRLGDFEFETTRDRKDFDTGPVKPGKKRPQWWWLVLLLAVISGALVYWFTRSEPTPESVPAVAPASLTEPRTEAETADTPPLPPLAVSDELVRQLVRAVSANPRLATWLTTDDLVRRFTATVVNLSEGISPRGHVGFLEPVVPFSVRRQGGLIVPNAKSYARYDGIADVVSSLDVTGTVELYHRLEPLVDEAFAELGYPEQDFDDVLVTALDHLLATPLVDAEVELVETTAAYEFADLDLEQLSSAQKLLLRTGPENVGKIQAMLRALRSELSR